LTIGEKVVIGVNCRIDLYTIEDNVYIGNGATIHRGCHIKSGAMIAPGTVILPFTTVPNNQVIKKKIKILDLGRKSRIISS
jgi:carbonic anhydrase/acetyltransferase-like protein (isoleucine patch superfamily)